MLTELRRLRVRGFKALQRLDLDFPGNVLILVGGNGSGKSSSLQAAAFIQYFIKGQPERFFEDRGWSVADIRTKADGDRGQIGFNVHLEHEDCSIAWGFVWSLVLREVVGESVWIQHERGELPKRILDYSRASRTLTVGSSKIKGIRSSGSMLSIIDPSVMDDGYSEILDCVSGWARGIFSLELLSPSAMRGGNRGPKTDIGPRGERLGGFLAALPPERKARLTARLASFYPVLDVETTRKKAGWIDLKIAESYPGLGKISANHMSDGFLRLLGIASIPEFGGEASMVLLDEIEDGIEPHILPDFIQLIARESDVQILMTSHSPVLVNRFDPEQICFIARSADGRTIAAGFHEIDEMQEGAEFFGAGEIWSQTSTTRITELVRRVAEKKEKRFNEGLSASRSEPEKVRSFLEG